MKSEGFWYLLYIFQQFKGEELQFHFPIFQKAEMHANTVVMCFYIVSLALHILKEKNVSVCQREEDSRDMKGGCSPCTCPISCFVEPPQIPRAWALGLKRTGAQP